jgi:hypothetical protein
VPLRTEAIFQPRLNAGEQISMCTLLRDEFSNGVCPIADCRRVAMSQDESDNQRQ